VAKTSESEIVVWLVGHMHSRGVYIGKKTEIYPNRWEMNKKIDEASGIA